MADVTRAYREVVVTFGESGGLVGILTLPATPQPGTPFAIMVNSGVIHRVGANRIYVAFARTFAAAGIPSLRFDLSGIGDSDRRTSAASLQETVHDDIGAAMTFLANKRGAERFSIIGLCSGAFDAFEHAQRDERVVGAAMLDMPGPFRNWSHLLYYVGARIFRAHTWRRRVKARDNLNAFLGPTRQRPNEQALAPLPGIRAGHSYHDLNRQMLALLARGVRLAFLFTGGVEETYNHRPQFHLRFPNAASQAGLRVAFAPWSDHTLTSRKARAFFGEWLRDWLLAQVAPRETARQTSDSAVNAATL